MSTEQSAAIAPELAWFKSSYSTGSGGECIEIALDWRKSSFSSGEGGECVEMSICPHAIHVRDSKDTARQGLTVSPAAWTSFVGLASQ
ncbi:DUF397 domain-containing protein [Streptomyces katsurahamanus]|uniref:DUF397 domain-containing protein n=1 Tax=Streptomyces katsurahamanus TaxID=2577098 RepID=A0ABW9NZS8_9ACTN|nr:DUF397 domain-containing protein [Streptomyces katsurahamanus]MQS38569.1 DUF397 domain-containing protein [Streptomyces katsurahamanus]